MSEEENTIILDTRSKDAYDKFHIKGAVHIDFSDFTEFKLNELIPNKEKRILIYCANNFYGDSQLVAKGGPANSKGIVLTVRPPNPIIQYLKVEKSKSPVALNIPTYINLYYYGYKNVYELSSSVNIKDNNLEVAGSMAGSR